MKKNLFEEPVKNELIQRSGNLLQTSAAKWGSMNVSEMLHHCNMAIANTLNNQGAIKSSTLKQKALRFVVLNFIPALPKGAKAPRQIDIKYNNITGLDFETEQNNFSLHLEELYNATSSINVNHPYFGNLTRKQWGVLTYMHLDHHLRQFGV